MGSPEVECGRVLLTHLWQYLDQEMDETACAQLEAHVRDCPTCRYALEADRKLKLLVRRCTAVEPIPPERVQALIVRVRRSIAVVDLPPTD
jgi:mycothiol system anti-sigma-R factor